MQTSTPPGPKRLIRSESTYLRDVAGSHGLSGRLRQAVEGSSREKLFEGAPDGFIDRNPACASQPGVPREHAQASVEDRNCGVQRV
jgi:hypothetical protein